MWGVPPQKQPAPLKNWTLAGKGDQHLSWLVVLTILKNDGVRQWGLDDNPYMKWKIKAMFQTTKQSVYDVDVEC